MSAKCITQSKIPNWSREKKFECKHNKIYWQLKNYLGFGLGAHSFFNNTRWHNTNNLKKYLTQDNFREEIIKSTRQSLDDKIWEKIAPHRVGYSNKKSFSNFVLKKK